MGASLIASDQPGCYGNTIVLYQRRLLVPCTGTKPKNIQHYSAAEDIHTLFSTANSCLLLKTAYVCLLLQSNAEYSSALYRCRVPAGAVDTILSYCHNNLADQTLLDLLPYLHEKGVGVISASFSSMGLLRKEVRHSHICQSAFLGSPVTVFYSPVTAVTPCPRAAAKHHLSQVL